MITEHRFSRARKIAMRVFRHESAILGIVLGVLIAGMGGVTKGLTITPANMMNIVVQSSMRGVASIGQAFVILSAGIDISIGGVGLMSAILGASLMTGNLELNIVGHPISTYVAIPIMLLVGVAWGAINGLLVSRFGIPALIVTLGMWQISTGAAFQICGGRAIMEQPSGVTFFGQGIIAGIPVPIVIFVVMAVVAYLVLEYTVFGRSVYATGGNPLSAWLSGISVRNIQLIVFAVSGLFAGLAGLISVGRVTSASMQTLSTLMLDTIAAVCVGGVSLAGGRGNIIGVVIGVLIIGVIDNGMSVLGAAPAVQGIVKGLIIIAAVGVDYVRRR